jgi:hypothetical protein
MRQGFLNCGLAAAVLTFGFGLGTAQAFVPAAGLTSASPAIVTPAAMCGRSCAGGGRYIPGGPGVCLERGLNYCGSSRESAPRVVVPIPGVEIGVRGPRREREVCRTTTVRRPDGSSRTTRECS